MCHNRVVLFVGEKTEYERNERKFWNFCIYLISILTFFVYITDYLYIYILFTKCLFQPFDLWEFSNVYLRFHLWQIFFLSF